MGWNWTTNKPPRDHPNYIMWEKENRLSLNWVDGPAKLFEWSGPQTFIHVLDFIDKWIDKKKVLIHCDQGFSRSPMLGMLYLAKRRKTISNISYESAVQDFKKIYSMFQPGGIGDYVNQHWSEIK